jgi:Flp pilus assembly protein TadB
VPALQRLRHTLILATQSRQQADAEAGQAMASAGLLVAAPAIFAVAVGALDRAVARLYLYEAAGVACVLAALLLSFFGWSWMQRLMAVALKSAQ